MATSIGWVERLGRPLPRPVAFVGLPLLFVLLTGFFIFLGFPYDRIGERLERLIQDSTGIEMDLGELGPYVSPFGLGLAAEEVVAVPPGSGIVQLDRVVLRPAWSTSWLQGRPAVYVGLSSPAGEVKGAVQIGTPHGFDGSIRDLDLSAPTVVDFLPVEDLTGMMDADANIAIGEEGPAGWVEFEVREGSVGIPGVPIGLPFDSLEGELEFGGEQAITVDRLDLEGPMLSASIQGTVGASGRGMTRGTLAMTAEVEAKGKAARDALRGAGLRLEREGPTTVEIGGTLSRPRFQ